MVQLRLTYFFVIGRRLIGKAPDRNANGGRLCQVARHPLRGLRSDRRRAQAAADQRSGGTAERRIVAIGSALRQIERETAGTGLLVGDRIGLGLRRGGRLRLWLARGGTLGACSRFVIDAEEGDALLQFLRLSGGQQQRLCIARGIAIKPEVLLLDEPCSALDPISTAKVEELIAELKNDYTVVIVTHNMQQAARCSDYTAYMYLGDLMEFGETEQMFFKPQRKETEDYITGRFG